MPDRRRDDRRRLGQPVALGDARRRSARSSRSDDADRQLGRAGQREADAGEGVGRRLVEVGERHPHRRRAGDHRDTPRARIDSSAVAGSKRCTSTTVAPTERLNAEDDVEPEDVVAAGSRRRRRRPARRGRVTERACSMLASRLPWREHRRPRRAGGAAREHQRGEVVGRDVDDRQRLGVEQLVERTRPSPASPSTRSRRARRTAIAARSTSRPRAGRAAVDDDGDRRRRRRARARSSGAGLAGLSGTATAPRPSDGEVGDRRTGGRCRR